MKENKTMTLKETREYRTEKFVNQIEAYIEDYYDCLREDDNSDMAKRYRRGLMHRINGMCEAFSILTGKQCMWNKDGLTIFEN